MLCTCSAPGNGGIRCSGGKQHEEKKWGGEGEGKTVAWAGVTKRFERRIERGMESRRRAAITKSVDHVRLSTVSLGKEYPEAPRSRGNRATPLVHNQSSYNPQGYMMTDQVVRRRNDYWWCGTISTS